MYLKAKKVSDMQYGGIWIKIHLNPKTRISVRKGRDCNDYNNILTLLARREA
jgi:hypothetical protein